MLAIKDRILIIPDEVESKTASGIIIPDAAKKKPRTGKVISVGSSVEEIFVDDHVMFGKYSGTEIEVEGNKYLVLKEDEILVVLDVH